MAGGIGKSTMAEAVYHRNYRQLEGHCFFRNVREETEKHGRAHVQQEILGEVYKRICAQKFYPRPLSECFKEKKSS
jgi:hypothetical protein